VIEGEQFANAYFDTETKIKMLVPLALDHNLWNIVLILMFPCQQCQGYDLLPRLTAPSPGI
jgi:hypothetical protein